MATLGDNAKKKQPGSGLMSIFKPKKPAGGPPNDIAGRVRSYPRGPRESELKEPAKKEELEKSATADVPDDVAGRVHHRDGYKMPKESGQTDPPKKPADGPDKPNEPEPVLTPRPPEPPSPPPSPPSPPAADAKSKENIGETREYIGGKRRTKRRRRTKRKLTKRRKTRKGNKRKRRTTKRR